VLAGAPQGRQRPLAQARGIEWEARSEHVPLDPFLARSQRSARN
jgi:hypothetical protein